MDTEHNEVLNFLASHHPFDQLPAQVLNVLPEQLKQRSFKRGSEIYAAGVDHRFFYLIHSGAVEIHEQDGSLAARLGEGDAFGERALLQNSQTSNSATAIEDSVLYRLSGEVFLDLCDGYPQFRYFVGPTGAGRLSGALDRLTRGDDSSVNLMTIPLTELIAREPVTLPSTTSIREAARVMAEQRVSSILVVDDDRLCGIVTDRDLRIRVIATGLPYEQPLTTIMTADPLTVPIKAYGFEALLAMARGNVHHLPVTDGKRVAGMITATDLLQRRSTSAIYMVGDIYKRQSPEDLAQVSTRLPEVLVNLVEANASSHSTGHVISSIAEAITCRLLQLAEAKLGSPPVPYAWLAAGSLGRMEQTAHSDQDNCLLLSDEYRPEHAEYFEALSRYVCDGLDACGYVYCPGEVMAMNPEWRQPLAVWKGYFGKWIEQPEPKALMLSSVFFDLRHVHGDIALFRELRAHVLDKSRTNRIFLAFMTGNALSHQPPLGFFRSFVLIKGGEHDHTLDLKLNGVVPIVDLARIYCLSGGLGPVNTQDRLAASSGAGELSLSGGADLRDALEFIGSIRLQHQSRCVKQGRKPDNFVAPEELSHFERNHLKDAFSVVRTLQATLGQRYQTGRM